VSPGRTLAPAIASCHRKSRGFRLEYPPLEVREWLIRLHSHRFTSPDGRYHAIIGREVRVATLHVHIRGVDSRTHHGGRPDLRHQRD
jgi:hypothetical protein